MRELKFRAWDKKENRMFKVFGLTWHYGIFLIEEKGRSRKHGSGETELMQYTGLKDKTGKEIYEGDIIEYRPVKPSKRTGELVFTSRKVFVVEYKHSYRYIGFNMGKTAHSRVIGNIYENEELCI